MVRRRSRQVKLPRARPVQIMSRVSVWGNYETTVTDCGRETEALAGARVGVAVDDGDVRVLMCGKVSWGNGERGGGGSSSPEGGESFIFTLKLGRTALGGITSLDPRPQLRGCSVDLIAQGASEWQS
ncbi:hypothetical protein QBC32DRAFT_399545 [Pseudoneurospora amorphoporcata]|uniref:Uncharacterized protein n=1 Tax=Pseudoneurospora amorphoporcata TaxID=241081 RepID=A0AAN6SE71_9PEZI|nr:hypothetical protein QBC32DRAFT_399545 [Pseudoneurospora amorphoporcata]